MVVRSLLPMVVVVVVQVTRFLPILRELEASRGRHAQMTWF